MSRLNKLGVPSGRIGPVCMLPPSPREIGSELRTSIGLLRPLFHRVWGLCTNLRSYDRSAWDNVQRQVDDLLTVERLTDKVMESEGDATPSRYERW